MKQYLIYTSTNTQLKNKLQRAVCDMIAAMNREVIARYAIERFISVVNEKITTINQSYPRCTPVNQIYLRSWDEESIDKDGIFDLDFSINDGQFSIRLYQLKEEI